MRVGQQRLSSPRPRTSTRPFCCSGRGAGLGCLVPANADYLWSRPAPWRTRMGHNTSPGVVWRSGNQRLGSSARTRGRSCACCCACRCPARCCRTWSCDVDLSSVTPYLLVNFFLLLLWLSPFNEDARARPAVRVRRSQRHRGARECAARHLLAAGLATAARRFIGWEVPVASFLPPRVANSVETTVREKRHRAAARRRGGRRDGSARRSPSCRASRSSSALLRVAVRLRSAAPDSSAIYAVKQAKVESESCSTLVIYGTSPASTAILPGASTRRMARRFVAWWCRLVALVITFVVVAFRKLTSSSSYLSSSSGATTTDQTRQAPPEPTRGVAF